MSKPDHLTFKRTQPEKNIFLVSKQSRFFELDMHPVVPTASTNQQDTKDEKENTVEIIKEIQTPPSVHMYDLVKERKKKQKRLDDYVFG